MRAKRVNQTNEIMPVDLDKRVKTRRLSNGLKVIVCENDMSRSPTPLPCSRQGLVTSQMPTMD